MIELLKPTQVISSQEIVRGMCENWFGQLGLKQGDAEDWETWHAQIETKIVAKLRVALFHDTRSNDRFTIQ